MNEKDRLKQVTQYAEMMANMMIDNYVVDDKISKAGMHQLLSYWVKVPDEFKRPVYDALLVRLKEENLINEPS